MHEKTANPKAKTESPITTVAMNANIDRAAAAITRTLGGPIRVYFFIESVESDSPRIESR